MHSGFTLGLLLVIFAVKERMGSCDSRSASSLRDRFLQKLLDWNGRVYKSGGFCIGARV